MPQRYTERAYEAAMKRDTLPESSITFHLNPGNHSEVPEDIFKLFFDVQGDIEKTGEMDYRTYAKNLWQRAFGEAQSTESEVYQQFEANLIRGLHDIPMNDLVYDDIRGTEKMRELIRALYGKATAIHLWSGGDNKSTGYQDAKISSSRNVHDFVKGMRDEGHIQDVRERTRYLVGDKKFDLLRKYLEDKKAKGEHSIKLVVIEDKRENFDPVVALVKEIFGDQGEVIPVWATYSREGQSERKRDATIFTTEKAKYNGIDSFSELGSEDWQKRLEGAELLVDFDGVICDNIKMRNAQAQVKWQSILEAARLLGVPENQLFKKSP
ncbi:hypothetical protein HY625_01300 [Candidatus Uhrbacteria bacterium]|nr:hypothetical protein [Candidatus Uhrbacteria bacterium]